MTPTPKTTPARPAEARPRLDKQLLRPHEYPALVRVGRDRDGGYVVPEDQIGPCRLLVSLGLNDEVSFDSDFLRRNPSARVVGVDPKVGWGFLVRRSATSAAKAALNVLRGNPGKRRRYLDSVRGCFAIPGLFRAPNRRIRKRVSLRAEPGSIRLAEILALSPAQSPHDVFLKMDIEGAEYEIVPEIVEQRGRIRCIAAEIHCLGLRVGDFNAAFRALSECFVVVHVHGNNWAAYDHANDFPTTVEVTLVNRDVLDERLPLSTANYPRPVLDKPCNPDREDYRLVFS